MESATDHLVMYITESTYDSNIFPLIIVRCKKSLQTNEQRKGSNDKNDVHMYKHQLDRREKLSMSGCRNHAYDTQRRYNQQQNICRELLLL